MNSFARWLAYELRSRQLCEIARLPSTLGVEEQKVLAWLAGRQYPAQHELERLAQYFGIPVESIPHYPASGIN